MIPIRINANTKCLTLDELKSRRKMLHLGMFENILDEIEVSQLLLLADLQPTELLWGLSSTTTEEHHMSVGAEWSTCFNEEV